MRDKEAVMAQSNLQGRTGGKFYDLASGAWVIVLLVAAGFVAVVTAVLVAWPAIAYLASHHLGLGG